MLDSLSGIFASVWREAVIMLIFYGLQLAMALVDMAAGIRKSRRAGLDITSRRLRDSIDKLCRYYGLSLLCSILDMALIVSVIHYNDMAGVDWPVFPIFTLIATIWVGGIEVVSVWEKLDRKTKARTQDAAAALAYIIKHANDADGLVALAERLKGPKEGRTVNETYTEDYGDSSAAR